MKKLLVRFYSSELRLSLKIIATSLVLGVLACLPLFFYLFVGEEGEAFGLGLLALSGVLAAQLGLVAGLLRLSWELYTGRH